MPTPVASLTVQKIVPCNPKEAFHAWTKPELFQQWFRPVAGFNAVATFDLRRGGKYQISMWKPDGALAVIVNGEFLTIEPPSYIEYTWEWAWPSEPATLNNTVVKVTFSDLGGDRTEVSLTHEGFTDAEDCEGHAKGWTSILAEMAASFGASR